MERAKLKSRFILTLRRAGFKAKKPNPSLGWAAFKSLALEPVPCVKEALLVEAGNFYPGEDLFHLTFVREFWVMENGEEYCEQLHCDFTCSPNDGLPDKQTFLWSYDFETLEDYFAAVELLKCFKAALRQPPESWQSEIFQFTQ